MDLLKQVIGYAEWGLIIGLTIFLFSSFSKIYGKFWVLILLVILPTWLLIGFIRGIEHIFFDNTYELFSLGGFTYLLAETLAPVLLFGGMVFGSKYYRFKKIKKQSNKTES